MKKQAQSRHLWTEKERNKVLVKVTNNDMGIALILGRYGVWWCGYNPILRALRRAVIDHMGYEQSPSDIYVDMDAHFRIGDWYYQCPLPFKAQHIMKVYERNPREWVFKPFQFTLRFNRHYSPRRG